MKKQKIKIRFTESEKKLIREFVHRIENVMWEKYRIMSDRMIAEAIENA